MKMEGYGIFWAIVEFLHHYENKLDINEIELIAEDLNIEKEKLEAVIFDFKLFTIKKNVISSKRVAQNLRLQKEKSKKAQMAAFSRWRGKENNANAILTQSETNTINEKKESKEKENKKIKTKKEKKETNENFYGILNNVFLSFENYSSLSKMCNNNDLLELIINELSENIALKKEQSYSSDLKDLHFIRLQKYLKQKQSFKTKPSISSQTTTEYLEKMRQEKGVPPPEEFFKSKENLIKKLKEQKQNADR